MAPSIPRNYFESPPPLDHTICGIVASFAHSATDTEPMLEMQSIEVFSGSPEDDDYYDRLTFLTAHPHGHWRKVNSVSQSKRQFVVAGSLKPFSVVARLPDNHRWTNTSLPPIGSSVSIRGQLIGQVNNTFIVLIDLTIFERPATASSPSKPNPGGYWERRKKKYDDEANGKKRR
ncbi:hypothetical protein BT96DRAFT_997670 [Gymnopus androsaceus JB14]|uniref:Uncharacterized protein n=1 Tax=Gymnopus androsaceus JB14 TaxID=1447944 RepID=A0A6A4HDY3_9AGAR|nr:hypothetical protein BT96DRAFT_997670 [Gymnopus androsaceus JB14]